MHGRPSDEAAGLQDRQDLAGYCATKGGVRLFAKAVAMECAVESDGIRVNTVHPGVIEEHREITWDPTRNRKFEAISLQRRVCLSPEAALVGRPTGRIVGSFTPATRPAGSPGVEG
jgi:NAD(P)-dependent dehydrogenase (short-subunit alcohol dehydrogenase family)